MAHHLGILELLHEVDGARPLLLVVDGEPQLLHRGLPTLPRVEQRLRHRLRAALERDVAAEVERPIASRTISSLICPPRATPAPSAPAPALSIVGSSITISRSAVVFWIAKPSFCTSSAVVKLRKSFLHSPSENLPRALTSSR